MPASQVDEEACYPAVAAGGVLGAAMRWAAGRAFPVGAGELPWTTLLINVSGSLVLGVLVGRWAGAGGPSGRTRAFVASGVLGAFTTFSALAVETDLLFRGGREAVGLLYALASVLLGVAAAAGGIAVGGRDRP